MAEAFGIAAGTLQIVGLGVGTAQKLYQFSKGVGAYPQRIERLADHVDANSRVLKQLAELLRDDAEAGHSLSKSFQRDIEVAAKTCRRVFEEIEAMFEKQRHSKIDKLKYTLFDHSQIEEFRTELSQCQITLNLMLLIHWRKDIAQTRQDIMDLLRGNLESAKVSTVPSIATTVDDFVGKLNMSDPGTAPQEQEEVQPLATEFEKLDPNGGPSRGMNNPMATEGPSMAFNRHFFTSLTAHTPTSQHQVKSEAPSIKTPSIGGSTFTGGSSTGGFHHYMWSARVEKDRTLSFSRMPIASAQAHEFAMANAVHLLKTLAKLDRHIESAIQAHTKKLQHDLIAVKTYQSRWSVPRRGVSSLQIATKETPATGGRNCEVDEAGSAQSPSRSSISNLCDFREGTLREHATVYQPNISTYRDSTSSTINKKKDSSTDHRRRFSRPTNIPPDRRAAAKSSKGSPAQRSGYESGDDELTGLEQFTNGQHCESQRTKRVDPSLRSNGSGWSTSPSTSRRASGRYKESHHSTGRLAATSGSSHPAMDEPDVLDFGSMTEEHKVEEGHRESFPGLHPADENPHPKDAPNPPDQLLRWSCTRAEDTNTIEKESTIRPVRYVRRRSRIRGTYPAALTEYSYLSASVSLAGGGKSDIDDISLKSSEKSEPSDKDLPAERRLTSAYETEGQSKNIDLGALADELIASLTARWGLADVTSTTPLVEVP